MTHSGAPIVILDAVRVWTAEGAQLLRDLSWTVRAGEHWALLGPNGAGKSTLLSVVGATRFPSSGSVELLGGRLGFVEIRKLRQQVGVVDPAQRVLDWMTVGDVVLTGATGTVRLIPHRGDPAKQARALELLDLLGLSAMVDRAIGTCSQGERQRVRLARALMPSPRLLLLDEPASGLDLPAREALLGALASLVATQPSLTTILISHHLEELPPTTTHALLLRRGGIVASGVASEVLTSALVSDCFDIPVEVDRHAGRWTARALPAWWPGDPTSPDGRQESVATRLA